MKMPLWLKRQGWLLDLAILILAVLAALAVGAVLLLMAGTNPLVAYKPLFLGAFSSRYGLTETLVKAVPLMLVGLGIVIAYRGGVLNIGGEGQIILGAVACAWVALTFSQLPGFLLAPLVLLAGIAAGAAWGLVPGVLKATVGANEVLITIMMNNIAFLLLTYLIRGPMIDPQEIAYGTGYPQSALIPASTWMLRLIPQSRLHLGLIIAVVCAALVYVFMWQTTLGYRIRVVGVNPRAARYAGIRVAQNMIVAMALSGGLAGLAGAIEVTGVHHRLLDGISAGYGFTGIVVALFARLHPAGVVPAAFFFAALLVGADMMQRTVGIPSSLVVAIEGLVVIFVVSSEIFALRKER
ncbi:MAG: ABC transporter permease [Chloroflexi bacterium]|nr:ABC transporter permease [Chloroflexota bacterium]